MIDDPPVMIELRYVGGPIDNNLRAKAAIFRQWATEIDELADQLESHNIRNVELRFESNLSIGLDKVLSWVYDAKKSVSSMMFHGELPTRFAVAEKPSKYTIESEYETRSAEAQRNTIERRVVAPRVGEFVYRSPLGGLYAKYVWDGSAFVFEELTP